MAHNQDYTKVWDPAGDSDGLSVYEVMRCLGINNQDVGAVCTSGQINEWSKYKPVNLPNKTGTLTEAERYNTNYGFSFTHTKFVNSAVQRALEFINYILEHTDAWKDDYSARQAYYRLTDFSAVNASGEENGYEKDALSPYTPSTDTSLWDYAGQVSLYKRASGYNLDFPDFVAITNNTYPNRQLDGWKDNWYYGLIVLDNAGTPAYFHSGKSYRDYEEGGGAFVPVTVSGLSASGTAAKPAIWVLTTATSAYDMTQNKEIVYIPKSKFNINKLAPTYVSVNVASISRGTITYTQGSNFVFDFNIGTGYTGSFYWDASQFHLNGAKGNMGVRFYLKGISEDIEEYESDYYGNTNLGEVTFGASSPLLNPSFYNAAKSITDINLNDAYQEVLSQIQAAGSSLMELDLYADFYFTSGEGSSQYHTVASFIGITSFNQSLGEIEF